MIFEVTEALAFSQPLEDTIQDVEHAIVMATKKWLVRESEEPEETHYKTEGINRICEALRAGYKRIERHLTRENQPVHSTEAAVTSPDDHIFRVTAARVFSQPLEVTLQNVERSIVLVACIRYGCSRAAVSNILHTGRGRLEEHFVAAEEELKLSGWPLLKSNNPNGHASTC